MRLTRQQYREAPVCENCEDYAYESQSKLVQRARGWVHAASNSVRCPGQEDDDTDDRGEPLRDWHTGAFITTGSNPDD